MTLRVLELNDAGIRVSDSGGVLLSSPGYALVTGQRIEFGESARSQSRLNPLNCFNQFWHKLNLDPFARPIAHYRHNADIAFSHLQDLAQAAELTGDLLLAVPGSFSRQQLAILLGLIKQCSFRAVGVVDAGLAAAVDQSHSDSLIHADIHLHQVVLSKLHKHNGELVRESVVQVPGTGWINMSESLIQLLTSAFIQQCRFNPQHNAQSEQVLLDGLPLWLQNGAEAGHDAGDDADDARRSVQITINHNNTVHQARVPRSSLQSRLQPFFQKITEQLQILDPQGQSRLLISDRLQALPGFVDESARHFSRISSVTADAVGSACLRYHETLQSSPDAMHFVTRLRPADSTAESAPRAQQLQPTHLLSRHQGRRLADGMLLCHVNGAIEVHERDKKISGQVLAEIAFDADHFSLRSKVVGAQINGVAAQPVQRLQLGDRIGFGNTTDTVELIRVQDGNE